MKSHNGKRPKVCLIVDNPLRDLEGLVLLGWHLAIKNVDVYLVSTSTMYEVFFIKPDFILFNYIRKANINFIKRCEHLGIKIGVLDTEGGILKDVDFFFQSIFKYIDKIDLYCLWGTKQYEALSKINILDSGSLKITGCPRYDFCVEPWSNALPDVPVSKKKMVLVNTNFPILQPRFQSPEREARELVTDVGFSREYVNSLLEQSRYARKEIVNAVQHLAPKFSDLLFIIRPHPFEDRSFYDATLHTLANVEVHQSGSVFPWIKEAVAVFHHNCSTSVEAVLMGKEPVHMAWIETPLLSQPASIAISQQAQSRRDLEDILERLSKHQQLHVSEEKMRLRGQVIKDWFYSNDGANSERTANAIIEKVEDHARGKASCGNAELLIYDVVVQRDMKSFVKHFFITVFGSGTYLRLKGNRYKKGKYFDATLVERIVERLGKSTKRPHAISVSRETRRHLQSCVRLTAGQG